MRHIAAFLVAVFTATSITGMLVAFPLSLVPPITFGVIGVAAARGAPLAAIMLAISFWIASLRGASKMTMVVAGGCSGLAFAVLGLVSRYSGFPRWTFHYRPWAALFLFDTHVGLAFFLRVGMSAMLAGLISGWVFSLILFGGTAGIRKASISFAGLIALLGGSLLLLLGAWFMMHDHRGDSLCAHTDAVRLRLGKTVYAVPAAYQPSIDFPIGFDHRAEVFERHEWNGTQAARQAPYELTYCQTTNDAPWAVTGFTIFPSNTRSLIPYQVMKVSVRRQDTAIPSPLKRLGLVSLPPSDADLKTFVPTGAVYSLSRTRNTAPYQYVYVDTVHGASLQIEMITNNGFSARDALRAAARLLRAVHANVAP